MRLLSKYQYPVDGRKIAIPSFPPITRIYFVFVVVLERPRLLAVNDTVYLPPVRYVWTGFCTVAFVTFPSPNDQFHAVGEPVELSVNATVSGAWPEVTFAENAVCGRGRYRECFKTNICRGIKFRNIRPGSSTIITIETFTSLGSSLR